MANQRNKYLGGGSGGVLSGLWLAYSSFTTAKDLPADAGWLAEMLADPPFYAPWLLLAACIVFLVWVFWHRDEQDEGGSGPTITQETRGDSAHNIVNHGTINMNAPAPAALQPMTQAKSVGDYARDLVRDKDWLIAQGPLPTYDPQPDFPLNGVLARIYGIVRNSNQDSGSKEKLYDWVNREIADKVSERRMAVWARLGNRARQKITIDQICAGTFDHRAKKFTLISIYGWPMTFEDIMFNKTEVDDVWPEPLRTTNDGRP